MKKIDWDKINKEFDEHADKCRKFDEQIAEERKNPDNYDLQQCSKTVDEFVNNKLNK